MVLNSNSNVSLRQWIIVFLYECRVTASDQWPHFPATQFGRNMAPGPVSLPPLPVVVAVIYGGDVNETTMTHDDDRGTMASRHWSRNSSEKSECDSVYLFTVAVLSCSPSTPAQLNTRVAFRVEWNETKRDYRKGENRVNKTAVMGFMHLNRQRLTLVSLLPVRRRRRVHV